MLTRLCIAVCRWKEKLNSDFSVQEEAQRQAYLVNCTYVYDTHWILLPLALANVLRVTQHGGVVEKKQGDGKESTHKSGDRIRPVTAKVTGETGDDAVTHVGETGRSSPVIINETGGNEATDSGTCEYTN